MNFFRACLLCFTLSFCALGETPDAILARMDKDAPNFRGVTADLKMTTFTKILDEKTVEGGTLQMQRVKPTETKAIIDFSGESDARTLTFEGKNVRIFYPKLNEYNEYGLGKNVLNQFLLLGFGSSGKDLSASYTITGEGTEKIGSTSTTKLLLVPKAPEVKERIEKVQIWIPEGATSPIQQQFHQPSGNYTLVAYSDVKLNPPGLKVDFKIPKTAKKQRK